MKFKDLIEQKQVGTIYHFTTVSTLEKLVYGTDGLEPFEFISHNDLFSCTRNYCLVQDIFPNDFDAKRGYVVRIAFDGDCISNNYKVQPVLGLKTSDSELFGIGKDRVSRHSGEAEEVIISKQKTYKLKKCIIGIDAAHYNMTQENELSGLISILKRKFKLELKFNRKFKPLKESESYDFREENFIII